MKRVLMTGATGFIGQHACRELRDSGWHVVGLVRPQSDRASLQAMGVQAETIDTQMLDSLFENHSCDAVVHCAAAYGRTGDELERLFDVNVVLPLKVMQAALRAGVRSFIHLDTCFTPDYPYLRAYTVSKKQMVAWGQLAAEDSPLQFMNIELQHPYGPGDRDGKFVPWIIKQCLGGGEINLTRGEQLKDFIYVEDVAKAIRKLLESAESLPLGFHQFECGYGKSCSVRRFVELVHQLTGSASELRFGALPTRPNEVMHSQADISRLKSLGWEPNVQLEEGLSRTIQAQTEAQSA